MFDREVLKIEYFLPKEALNAFQIDLNDPSKRWAGITSYLDLWTSEELSEIEKEAMKIENCD